MSFPFSAYSILHHIWMNGKKILLFSHFVDVFNDTWFFIFKHKFQFRVSSKIEHEESISSASLHIWYFRGSLCSSFTENPWIFTKSPTLRNSKSEFVNGLSKQQPDKSKLDHFFDTESTWKLSAKFIEKFWRFSELTWNERAQFYYLKIRMTTGGSQQKCRNIEISAENEWAMMKMISEFCDVNRDILKIASRKQVASRTITRNMKCRREAESENAENWVMAINLIL